MRIFDHNRPRFSRCQLATVILLWFGAAVFAIYISAEQQAAAAGEQRFASYLLADELRQSSDDLTRMARSYVVTGDPLYKQHYQEILDIRNGKKPRPRDYHQLYWDLVLSDDHRPRPLSGRAVSLLELMRRAGFTEQEFAKLADAKVHADALTKIEFDAMALVEAPTPGLERRRLQASQMLNDSAYHQAKYDIMRPIGEFHQLMEQRTARTMSSSAKTASALLILFIITGLAAMLAFWRANRAVHAVLGCSVDQLHARIRRIGGGDFSAQRTIADIPDDSVMTCLLETERRLAKLVEERESAEAKNQRLTKLYAALSQCNQAIVRCRNREELFEQICRDAVMFGGMKMAWIGLLDQQCHFVRPVAWYGNGADYLSDIRIALDAGHLSGRGPTGTAMREDRPYWCQDFLADPATAPWQERGNRFGWRASASLPLHCDGRVIGAFSLYASECHAFDEAARNLLVEMAMDIDYALNNFRHEEERKQAVNDLARSHGLLKSIIDNVPIRVFWKDRQLRFAGCNPAFARDAGYESSEALIGKDDYDLCWKEQAASYRADDLEVMASRRAKLFYEEEQTTPDGRQFWLRTSKVPLKDEIGEVIGILGIYEDITEQKQNEQHIHFLANFDPLTGLPNRAQLNEHLKYALSLAKRSNGHLALMFLDLDHFKDINDTLGHSVGDSVLVELAHRFRILLREEDTVTRLGGDEFIFLLPGTDVQGAANVAQKLLDVIVDPLRIPPYELILTASVGIALFPEDGLNLETLSQSADAAMYRAKQDGRHGYSFFTPEMHARSTRNLQLLNALRHALELEQFKVYYQPQIDGNRGEIIGSEALLRWWHPELGAISPAEFIPIAEDSGLILPIGEWVMRTAARQARQWRDQCLPVSTMAVNLSAVQFRSPDLVDMVARILNEEGLPSSCLELELTESVAMNNPQNAIAIMEKLSALGVHLSIDDFGTGYSSLSYLKKFKVCKLKIDQSFVRDIPNDSDDKSIVAAIISLASNLGLKTIAEGVETEAQRDFLCQLACDQLQGYLFGRPMPAAQFEVLLKESRARDAEGAGIL